MRTVYTIGFAGKVAEGFFGALRRAGVELLLDVRLRNASQLAGYRAGRLGWAACEERFLALLRERRVEERLERGLFDAPDGAAVQRSDAGAVPPAAGR